MRSIPDLKDLKLEKTKNTSQHKNTQHLSIQDPVQKLGDGWEKEPSTDR